LEGVFGTGTAPNDGDCARPSVDVGAIVLYDLAAMASDLRKLVVPVALLGVLLIVVAFIYFLDTAHGLPSFFPGHVSAGNSEATHHHTKHGIAALVVALACFAFAWFQSGPKTHTADA
jgi:hypothetical protein